MHPALWMLLKFRFVGWLRRMRRAMGTIKGLLVTIAGGMLCVIWLLSVVSFAPPATEQHLQTVREIGPLAILSLCLFNFFFSAGERAISFNPAEVNFLFPGPFSRRQLLMYKLVAMSAGAVLLGLFLGLMLRRHVSGFVQGLIGITLAMLFIQWFTMILALVSCVIGARAYNRQRKVILVLLAVVIGVSVWQQGAPLFQRHWLEVFRELKQNPFVQIILAPFSWPIRAMTAETYWPDLAKWGALAIVGDGVLLLIIFGLDAHYLETAAAASEKLYKKLEKLRRGGIAGPGLGAGGKVRFRLPTLPRWGGVGPLAWRQFLAAGRNPWWIVTSLIFASIFLASMVSAVRGELEDNPAVPLISGATMLVMMGLFMPALMQFDFRADIDRMEVLKSLPMPPWRLVLGQLLAPVTLFTLIQCLLLVIVPLVLNQFHPLILAAIPFLISLNFFLFAVENLLFLWFPTRLMAATPGDFQNFGRTMLLYLVKMILLMVIIGAASLLAVLFYFLAGESLTAGLVVGWLCVTAVTAGLLPLLCLAFRAYDVSRDTPP